MTTFLGISTHSIGRVHIAAFKALVEAGDYGVTFWHDDERYNIHDRRNPPQDVRVGCWDLVEWDLATEDRAANATIYSLNSRGKRWYEEMCKEHDWL